MRTNASIVKLMKLSRAFTLVELLVVCSILGVLAALLLPVLNKAKNQAAKTSDLNNLKQIMVAVHIYTTDNLEVLPPPNWDGGHGDTGGWLYKPSASATNFSFDVKTGLLWPTLRNAKLYFCPMDGQGTTDFQDRPQQISSYAINGAVIGYDFNIYPPVKLTRMQPTDCAFWETDEKHPDYFNDGANWPGEGVSSRHQNGGIQAAFDASVNYVRLNTWRAEVAYANRNRLWCYPGRPDGGGPNGHNQ